MKNPIVASFRFSACIAITVATTLTFGFSTQAATLTWDANGATAAQTDGAGAWLTANQWWNGTANTNWTSGDDALFGNSGVGGAVTLASATTATSLTFNSFTGTYTLGAAANILTIGSGGITVNAGAGAVNLVSKITLGGAQSWTNGSSSTLSLTSTTAGALALGGNLLTLNGGAFNFALTSTATTTGAGGVKITAGSAVTNSSTVNPFGAGTLELNSGSITNNATATVRTISNAVSITGDFTFGSGGSAGTNTFTGATTTTGNRILTSNTSQAIFSNATALALGGNLTVNGTGGIVLSGTGGISGTSDIAISTTGTVASTIGAGPINSTGTITNNGSGASTTTLSGVVASTVSAITQNAANGTLSISGTNAAYTGTTTLTSGTLNIINAKALGSGSLVINGGALNSSSATNALSNTAITGATSANGSSTILTTNTTGLSLGQFVYGTGIATGAYITAISANTSITVSSPNTAGISGTLTFGALLPQTWAADFAFTGTANLNAGSGAISLGANPGATRTVTVNANTLTVGGAISNGTHGTTPAVNLAKAGAGTLTIIGTDALGYTGSTTVSAGTLSVSGANVSYSGATTLDGGTLRLGNPVNANVLQALGSSNIALNSGTLQLRANGSTGALPQTIVAGNNVTMGSNAATIDVGNNGANSSHTITLGSLTLGTGQLNVTSGNSYKLSFTGAASTLTGNATFNPTTGGVGIGGVLGESGGSGYTITKIGSGVLTLSGAHTFTGPITVKEGTLAVGANAPSGAAGALGNSTSAILVGDTTGNSNAFLNIAGDFNVGRNIVVQAGNGGVVTIGSDNTSNFTSTFSGDIALGSGGVAHNAVFTSGNFHQMVYSGTVSGTGGITTIGGSSTSKVIINGNNTYSGGTTMTAGVLRVGHNNALGTGTITINGGTLGSQTAGITLANNQTWAGDFAAGISTFSGGSAITTSGTNTIAGGTRTIGVNNVDWVVNGTIADGGNNYGVILKNASTDNVGANISLGGANTFGGGLTLVGAISTRTLTVTTSTATAAGSGQTTLTNATGSILKLAAALSVDSLNSGIAAPTFTAGTGGTNGPQSLVFTGGGGTGAAGTATISGGLITGVTITNYGKNYSSAPTITVTNGGSGTVTTTFGSSSVKLQANTLTLSGTNASPATYAGIISGTGGSLVKDGTGTQTLSGINTYTGATTINDGTLALASTGSISNTSGVSLGTGGTFDVSAKGAGGYTVNNLTGSGDVIGSLTVSTQLAIGNSPGTTTFDNLTLGAASTYIYELTGGGSPGAGSADLGIVSGNLTIVSGAVLDLAQLGSYTVGNKFTLFAYTGVLSGIFKDTGAVDLTDGATFTDASGIWSIDYNDTTAGLNGGTTLGASYVTITAVPETTAALLGGLGLLTLLRRRRI